MTDHLPTCSVLNRIEINFNEITCNFFQRLSFFTPFFSYLSFPKYFPQIKIPPKFIMRGDPKKAKMAETNAVITQLAIENNFCKNNLLVYFSFLIKK